MTYKRYFTKIVLILMLFLGILIALVPIVLTVSTSFKTKPEITTVPPSFFPNSFSNFGNYIDVWKRINAGRLLVNSLVLSAVVLMVSLVLAPLTGYGFAKYKFRGKEIAYFAIIGILMVPFQSVAIPLFKWLDKFGLIDTFPGLALPMLVSAFGVLLMREAITLIPNDYIDAARIDGYSELSIFFRIIMPMIKASLAALGIIKFMWTWNEFFWPLLVITTNTKAPITLGLSYLSNMYFKEYNLISAAALLSLLPLFLIFVIFRKWMISALAGSGLKA